MPSSDGIIFGRTIFHLATNLFVYGTLLIDDLFHRIVKGRYQKMPGTITGYERRKVINQVYPALIPSMSIDEEVSGAIYIKINDEDIGRLDHFEGEMYQRTAVLVHIHPNQTWNAETYVCMKSFLHLVDPHTWSPANFSQEARNRFLKEFPGWELI